MLSPMPSNGMLSRPSNALHGTAHIPGDKSISHRALIFGAMAVGHTTITGLLEGEDVLGTAKAMQALGAQITRDDAGIWHVHGVGVGGFLEPKQIIDCGNSGTSVRLIIGAVATCPFCTTFTGDDSLNKRPMARVCDPLSLFGAQSVGRSGGRLPLTLMGAHHPVPVNYTLPVPSAQVKSAVLLAGLNVNGTTTVLEKERTRDHTERMLTNFGATLSTQDTDEGHLITLEGQPDLRAQDVIVPSDPSSAAFIVCAALIVPGSDVLVPNIGLNPARAGLFYTLQDMGADLQFENMRDENGEPVADLRARFSHHLKAITVPAERAASMIDEYPILSIVAACAHGTTHMPGVGELRLKESDRIAAMADGLRDMGIRVDDGPDWWAVTGNGHGTIAGGICAKTHLDHRIAMAFLIAGLVGKTAIEIDNGAPIATSFPQFVALMQHLGAQIESVPR